MRGTTVAVVVPSKDRAASLARLLDALAAQTRRPDQVVVVDDGSSDSTAALLAGRPEVVAVSLPVSAGPARARNCGIAVADADLIAFTDDDCQPASDWLERLVAAYEGGAEVVLGRTSADETAYTTRGPWDHFMVTAGSDPMYSTCNIGYSSALLHRLGGFDESFSGTHGGAQWGEDTDLGLRAADLGVVVAFDQDCVVDHDVVSRSWLTYCLAGLRRQGLPHLVRTHPSFRENLPAGVFVNQAHAWAPLALLGLVGGAVVATQAPVVGVSLAAASALPWVRFRTRVWPVYARRRSLPYVLPMLWVADLLETAFVVVAAGKSRVLVV